MANGDYFNMQQQPWYATQTTAVPQYQHSYGKTMNTSPSQFTPIENNTGLMTIFVNSEEEVGYYPVAAGVTVMLISFNLGKFWLKSTNKNGVPEPLRQFSFEEKQVETIDTSYATKDEIKTLNDKIDKLIAELGGAQ